MQVFLKALLVSYTFFQETQSNAYVWRNIPTTMTYAHRIPHARRVTPAFCLDLYWRYTQCSKAAAPFVQGELRPALPNGCYVTLRATSSCRPQRHLALTSRLLHLKRAFSQLMRRKTLCACLFIYLKFIYLFIYWAAVAITQTVFGLRSQEIIYKRNRWRAICYSKKPRRH